MPCDGRTAESRLEPFQERLGSDFREQHERLFPLTETLGDRLEIDFRLARACDPVEQNRIKPFRWLTRGSPPLRAARR